MTLYSYRKAPVTTRDETGNNEKNKPGVLTVATILDNLVEILRKRSSSAKPITLALPFIFIISGLGILYSQIKPYAIHLIQSKITNTLDQEIVPLVPESYEKIRTAYISDPPVQYFSNLLESQTQITRGSEYEGEFYLTIEKIQISDAPVIANVDSLNESSYRSALDKGFAHFKGTRLPGENGNVFIYGHSAAGDYAYKNPQDVITAFSRLFNLNIGDKISIKFEGEEFHYIVKKVKEVSPEETNILHNISNRKTLTLMTCSPPGLNTERLIVIANQQ